MSRSYKRFLILTSPRCGTHMLCSALAQHPGIVSHSEVFNPDYGVDAPIEETTPEETILNEFVFYDYPSSIDAVGFALHRGGARFGRWPTLWQRLERDPDLHIISLSRVHLLGRYVSYRLMRERQDRSEPRIITPEELQTDFRIQETTVSAFDERFAQHPILRVKYEQMVDNWEDQILRIQEFLGVPPRPLKPTTVPNRGLYYRRVIENYDELVQHFKGTRWSWLFATGPLPPRPASS